MIRTSAVAAALLSAAPATAQDHSMHDMGHMPGMAMPAPAPAPVPASPSDPAPAGPAAAMPPMPADPYADRNFDPAAMQRARARMMAEGGGQTFHQILVNLAELRAQGGQTGYRWDGEAWLGGDLDRAVVKTEGEGQARGGVEAAEAQLLYSHAIGPYFNLQGGVRQDIRPAAARSYASIGVEGLAPYWFQVEARAFLSTHGDLLGRVEAWVDQRLTQRLVLQPRVELNLAAQDVRATRTGAGLSDAELGLRLRYEFARTFAPYVGLSYETRTGRTADFVRAEGKKPTSLGFVAGVRFWF